MSDFQAIPEELRRLPQWLLWRSQIVDGRPTKVPYTAIGRKASTTDPNTWTDFDTAVKTSERFDGIGFVFTKDDPYFGVDLDSKQRAVFDKQTGQLAPWAAEIVDALHTYTELSVSGKGLHIIGKGKLPEGGRRSCDVEMYSHSRYFCMTGNHLAGTPMEINERTAEIAAVHAKVFGQAEHPQERKDQVLPGAKDGDADAAPRRTAGAGMVRTDDDALLAKARAAKNGDKFSALWRGDCTGYSSQSEADMALCSMLAFWTRRDGFRIDRLFRKSGLMRPKWGERHHSNGQTYGAWTIDLALKGSGETYGAGKRGAGGEAVHAADMAKQIKNVLASELDDAAKAEQACTLAAQLQGLQRSAAVNQIKQATGLLKPDIKAEIDRIAEGQRPCSGRTMHGIATEYVRERLAPRFIVRERDTEIWCETPGCKMRQAEMCSMLESELLERIKTADDYAEPTRTDPTKPIKQLQQVLRAVWADLVKELPEETGSTELGTDSRAAKAFRLMIEELWLAPETWMKFTEQGQADDRGEHVERMSLASRARELAHLRSDRPAWQRVLKGVNGFYRIEDGKAWLGMRYDLCRGEIKGHKIESVKDQADLTLLMKRYGLADETGTVTDRLREDGKQQRLVVLSRALCDLLIELEDGNDGEPLSHDEHQAPVTGGSLDGAKMPWDDDPPEDGKSVAQ
ncbi:MAG TPA: hypothetical protein VM425_10680 [Myxococcota bacterium]|nr:hypothetical protein [Myxococcota bacterium]